MKSVKTIKYVQMDKDMNFIKLHVKTTQTQQNYY